MLWFQLKLQPDRGFSRGRVQRAEAAWPSRVPLAWPASFDCCATNWKWHGAVRLQNLGQGWRGFTVWLCPCRAEPMKNPVGIGFYLNKTYYYLRRAKHTTRCCTNRKPPYGHWRIHTGGRPHPDARSRGLGTAPPTQGQRTPYKHHPPLHYVRRQRARRSVIFSDVCSHPHTQHGPPPVHRDRRDRRPCAGPLGPAGRADAPYRRTRGAGAGAGGNDRAAVDNGSGPCLSTARPKDTRSTTTTAQRTQANGSTSGPTTIGHRPHFVRPRSASGCFRAAAHWVGVGCTSIPAHCPGALYSRST